MTWTGSIGGTLPDYNVVLERREEDKEGYPYIAERLTARDVQTGEIVFELEMNPDEDWDDTEDIAKDMGLKVGDFDFDGYKDIMFYYFIGDSGKFWYTACLWDSANNTYRQNESFSDIVNATVDEKREVILEVMWRPDGRYDATYGFEDGTFFKQGELTVFYTPNASQGKDHWSYTEKDGRDDTVNELSVHTSAGGPPPEKAAQYYAPGSQWDLNNPVWESGDYFLYGGGD